MRLFRISILVVLTFVILRGSGLMDQAGGGSVVGTVTDPSGAAVPEIKRFSRVSAPAGGPGERTSVGGSVW